MQDWNELAEPPFQVAIGGKSYTIPPVGIRVGVVLTRAASSDPAVKAAALAELSDTETWYRAILGPAYDEMYADDVSAAAVARAAFAALTRFNLGTEQAEVAWRVGQDPEALAAALAAMKTATSTPE